MNTVVKCRKCDLHFTHTEVDTHCPFCATLYEKEVPVKLKVETGSKKNYKNNSKESFKIWKEETR